MPADRFVLRPLDGAGAGSGHTRRCRELALSLGSTARIIVDEPEGGKDSIRENTLVIFDRRESSVADMAEFAALGTPVLLDDDGPARRDAPFVVDTIPGPRRGCANLASPDLLHLPPKTRTPDPQGEILVSFGGQDPAGLTIPVLTALTENGAVDPGRITLTRPQSKEFDLPAPLSGIRILHAPGSLRDELGGFGLVICSFGLTLWESLAAGCAVLTVEPGQYHAELSEFSRIPGIGTVGKNGDGRLDAASVKRLLRLLKDVEYLTGAANRAAEVFETRGEGYLLPSLLKSLEAPSPHCAACGRLLPRVIARFHRRSYYRCSECRIIGLYRFDRKEDEYGSAYFDAEYRNQYGQTYLEDFDAIKAMAAPRLAVIGRKVNSGRLLDVGCAYGPFLQAATEGGFEAHGIDISPAAAEYVRKRLGIPASAGSFTDARTVKELGGEKFDVLSLWYVIEHFPDLNRVLRTLSRMVRAGGVLALSTPNGSGISARRSLRRFLDSSPADHYTVWTPRSAGRILRPYGFRVYRIRVTGHHPERFPGSPKIGGMAYRIVMFASRLLRLGDTFEIYAVRLGKGKKS